MKKLVCAVLLVIFASAVYGSDIQASDVQAAARNADKILKASREIAKKHGVKPGDVAVLELHMMIAGAK